MYFPYLRGRQFELIALRELVDGKYIGKKIIPIIEPIKPTSTLVKTIHQFNNKSCDIALICNPSVGDFVKEINELTRENAPVALNLIEEMKKESLIKSYMIKKDAPPKIKSKTDKYNYLIINANRDCMDDFLDIYEEGLPRYSLIPNDKALKRLIPNSKVLLVDHYNKQTRNVDYLNNDDEFFSSDHLEYQEEGFIGFSDYSVVGLEFTESGFAPLAVAIHIVYFNTRKELRIKHFVSDSNTDINDPAKKFGEALNKLVQWCDTNKVHKTEGLKQFYECHKTGRYPGLGTVKKLSIMHHLELMSKFLEGEI
jgi:hypothetical protein